MATGAKTELFARNIPGGLFIINNESITTGDIYFVHSGTGTDAAGYGRNPDAPVATIDYAIGLCTANKGDRIYVMPGHAETISAAAGIDCDVAGISIIGLGNGTNRPTVTAGTANTVDIDIDAANVTIENIRFISNFLDIAALIDVNADDFTLRKCEFTEAGANLNSKIIVQDAAAGGSDRITIEDCKFVCPDSTNTHVVNFAGTGDGHIVRRNILIGDWGTMAIGGAGVITNCCIIDNVISNAATDNDSCINLAATATGIVMRNLACGGAAQANGITATACAIAQNYYGVVSEDLSAILDPIAT
jgi:hypothetical protein